VKMILEGLLTNRHLLMKLFVLRIAWEDGSGRTVIYNTLI